MPSKVDTCKIAESDLASVIGLLAEARNSDRSSFHRIGRRTRVVLALKLIDKSARNLRRTYKLGGDNK